MTKRGRKPGKKLDKNYFTQEQEDAVISYLNAETFDEKNQIYNEKLRHAFHKMVESIIRRYKLYIPDEDFEETYVDTLSFLLTKMDKFKPGKNKKAYSYYGTICKNHLIGRIQEYSKNTQRNVQYDTVSNGFVNNIRYSDFDGNNNVASESVSEMIKRVDEMLLSPDTYKLKENEIRMGKALKNLLENWDFVLSTDGSNKLNKSAILLFIKEDTGFDTKTIRDSMKKYKNEFYEIKKNIIA